MKTTDNEMVTTPHNPSTHTAISNKRLLELKRKARQHDAALAALREQHQIVIQFRDYVRSTHPNCKLVADLNATLAAAESEGQ